MQFLLSDLQIHHSVKKEERFEPKPFLGDPPDLIDFKSPVHAKVVAELITGEVLVSGDVSTVITCSCARCLTNFDKKIDAKFKQSFEEVEPVVDVDYFIKEAVVLDLPLKAVCKDDCLGLCPTCGQNRNEALCKCPAVDAHPAWGALKEIKFPQK